MSHTPAVDSRPSGRSAWRVATACAGISLACVELVACSLLGRSEVKAPELAYDLPEPPPPVHTLPSSRGGGEDSLDQAPASRSAASPARVGAVREVARPSVWPFHLSPWPTEVTYAGEVTAPLPVEVTETAATPPPLAHGPAAAGAPQASRSSDARNLTGRASIMWFMEWLWVAALVLVLLGGWLLMLARRRERQRASRLASPRLTDEEIAFLALTWKSAPAQDVAPTFEDLDVAEGETLPAECADCDVRESPVGVPAPETPYPLVAVFNTLSSPGGPCMQRCAGEALRQQEPMIRAAVDMGEGQGVSFKIADKVGWPLWARLHHPGAGVVLNPSLTMLPLEPISTSTGKSAAVAPKTIEVPTSENTSSAEQVEALEAYLQHHPDDLDTQRAVGVRLLTDAREQTDEATRAGMLDASIHMLREVVEADRETAPHEELGEACYLRALIGADMDEALLSEAELALRTAMRRDDRFDSEAAWQLQRVLQVAPHGIERERVVGRLKEACGLLGNGAGASGGAPAWKSAWLTAEWRWLVASCQNATERRLRFRQLHAKWSPLMERETAAEVLAAWIGLLCAMAESLTGQVAMERYVEAQVALSRLRAEDGKSVRYARAFVATALGSARLERDTARATLLEEAGVVLQRYVDSDDSLRLDACKVVLAQVRGKDAIAARPLYLRAAELARPLTVVPTLAIDALRCMLVALLALGEEKDRRVYAKCLEVVTDPDDADSLLLLAECCLRAADHRAGCLHAEGAWRAGAALSPTLLGQWQAAYPAWAALEGASVDVIKNRHCLRMAASVGDRARVPV